jgi:hypothetical protein
MFPYWTEIVFTLLGGIVGLFFGLDGWRGSDDASPLERTLRMRNLGFVVGPLLATFIGDLKFGFFDEGSKPRLVALYVITLVLGLLLIVGSTYVFLLVKFSYYKYFKPEYHPPPPFSPVNDYLYYGYSLHKRNWERALAQSRRDAIDYRNRDVLPKYAELLAGAVAMVSHFLNNQTEDLRRDTIKRILRTMCDAVRAYRRHPGSIKINANLMTVYETDERPEIWQKKLKFFSGALGDYSRVLLLDVYAYEEGAQDFALPVTDRHVPQAEDKVLPGAPEALNQNRTVVVDDTGKIQYPSYVSPALRSEMKSYFRKMGFKSFASLIVTNSGNQVGIVNIDTSVKFAFGKTQQEKDQVTHLLVPFSVLLGFLVKQ